MSNTTGVCSEERPQTEFCVLLSFYSQIGSCALILLLTVSSGVWPGLHQPAQGGRGWRDQRGDPAAGVCIQGGLLHGSAVGAADGGDAKPLRGVQLAVREREAQPAAAGAPRGELPHIVCSLGDIKTCCTTVFN